MMNDSRGKLPVHVVAVIYNLCSAFTGIIENNRHVVGKSKFFLVVNTFRVILATKLGGRTLDSSALGMNCLSAAGSNGSMMTNNTSRIRRNSDGGNVIVMDADDEVMET